MVADAGEYRIYFWGIINPLTMVVLFVFRKQEVVFNSLFTAGNLIICSVIGLLMYGGEAE